MLATVTVSQHKAARRCELLFCNSQMRTSLHRLTDGDLSCLQHKAAKRLPESTDSRAAQLLLDKLCALYYDKKARYTDSQRYEKLRYDMLIAAIDGALPEHSSAMVCILPILSAQTV